MSTLGTFLADVGATKTALAEAAGVRWQTVHEIIEGRSEPRVAMASKLAQATVALAVGTGVEPLTPAEILGVADWAPEPEAAE